MSFGYCAMVHALNFMVRETRTMATNHGHKPWPRIIGTNHGHESLAQTMATNHGKWLVCKQSFDTNTYQQSLAA